MYKEYRKYFGKKFWKQKDGYWANFMPIHAHRWVWINHYGAIPEGMDIHHIDEDKSNNEIENLQMLSRSEHLKLHWRDENLRKERRILLNEIRPKVHAWLRSDEGRKVQSEASKKSWLYRKTSMKECEWCKKEFNTPQSWARFCHENCYMQYKRSLPSSIEDFICDYCKQLGNRLKYTKKRFCSISCGAKNSSSLRVKKGSL